MVSSRSLLVTSRARIIRDASSSSAWMRTGIDRSSKMNVVPWQTSPCHRAPGRSACQRRRALPPLPSTGGARVKPRSANILRTVHSFTSSPTRPSARSVRRMTVTLT